MVCLLLRVKQLSMAIYHPQTEDLAKWMNQAIKDFIRKTTGAFPIQWDWYLDPLLFAVQKTSQPSLAIFPFEQVYRWKP